MSDQDPDEKEDTKLYREACEKLGKHFHSVMIFATRHDAGGEGGTVNVAWGEGNWYARFGQVRDWLIKQEERTRQEVRGEDD